MGANEGSTNWTAALQALSKDASPGERADLIVALLENHADPIAVIRAVVEKIKQSDRLSAAAPLALLSEQALAEDWNRPEEDAAWSSLQPGK